MQQTAPLPSPSPRGPGIIVLCTGNSARSQMAAGFLEREAAGRFPVYSAGTEPAEAVHPLAIRVMQEKGIDLSGRKPRHLRDFLGVVPVHTIAIVCDGAAKSCPAIWPGAQERLLWPLEDPAAAAGDEQARLAKFRQIRDALEEKVAAWMAAGGLGAAAAG